MVAVVDICNMALSEIGGQRIASLTEESVEAHACSLWYDRVRQQVLRAAFWGCARRSTLLTLHGDGEGLGAWTYTYTYPPDCLHARFIDAQESKFPVFTTATIEVTGGVDRVILANVESPTLWYVYDSTDPSTWDPLLVQAVVDALAASIAVEVTGKRSYRVDLFQKANVSILAARAASAQELRYDLTDKPARLRAMDDWDDLSFDASPYVAPDGPLFV